MIDYGEAPSNQCQLDTNEKGAKLMRDARAWIEANPDAWEGYMIIAKSNSVGGKASPNYVLQTVRNSYRVSVRNALAPALARIAMEIDPSVNFRLAKSQADGFCEAVL